MLIDARLDAAKTDGGVFAERYRSDVPKLLEAIDVLRDALEQVATPYCDFCANADEQMHDHDCPVANALAAVSQKGK